jgi:hypothetical protein
MAKQKTSLEALTAAALAAELPVQRGNVVTLQRDDAKKASGPKHTSLYLHPAVRRAIQEIAFQYDKKPHDLYLEGIDMMLASYGKPNSASLSGK